MDVEITPDVLRVESSGPTDRVLPDPEMAMNDGYTTVSPDSRDQSPGPWQTDRDFQRSEKIPTVSKIETELGCGTTVTF
ncbi:hypothetical protein [Ruminococcus sp. HUN007]|uniref:hypothetical protein n=1 Tax=Ruminococcus sp. HUN007 TaxID=1514668 RepID=UPI0005D1F4A6|nr:hypothetical protein [Ruminococcus sp. HUN007]